MVEMMSKHTVDVPEIVDEMIRRGEIPAGFRSRAIVECERMIMAEVRKVFRVRVESAVSKALKNILARAAS